MSRFLPMLAAVLFLLTPLGPYRAAMSMEGEAPVLIIGGPGINSDIYGKDQEFLYQVYQTFGVAARGFKPINVQFRKDSAVTQQGERFDAVRENRTSIRNAAVRVGEMAANNRQSVVMLDMDLPGTDIAAFKGIFGAGLHAPLRIMGRKEPTEEIGRYLDAVRTDWNRETERTAAFIEEAARQFKQRWGEKARVVVVGHSGFTNAIDLVPVKDRSGTRLIDLRIFESPMVHQLRYHDKERTIFLCHDSDLKSSNMGNSWSPRSVGDLTREGVVFQIHGGVTGYGERVDEFLLQAMKNVPVSKLPWDKLLPGSEEHSTLFRTNRVFDMDIRTDGETLKNVRGTPAGLIRAAESMAGNVPSMGSSLISVAREKKANESRVGGVTLTKPASVPIDASDIVQLVVTPNRRLAFLTRSGRSILLPDYNAQITAAACACVYGDRPPEISLTLADDSGTPYKIVQYISQPLRFTRLGDLMLEADRVLADVAFGDRVSYRAPSGIPNYHPYMEIIQDHEAFRSGKIGIRTWIVPAAIDTKMNGDELTVERTMMAVRFEAFDTKRTTEYFSSYTEPGRHDAAGEFVASALTARFGSLEEEYPVLRELSRAAAVVGILIWARQHNILPTQATFNDILAGGYRQDGDRNTISGDGRRYLTSGGESHEVLPVPGDRKISVAQLSRPLPVFNEWGLSRIIWDDNTESRIEYNDGRVSRLVGRNGSSARVLYDNLARPIAIIGVGSRGMAVLWNRDIPLLFTDVKVRPESEDFVITRDSRVTVDHDVTGAFGAKIGAWLAAQEKNDGTEAWLLGAAPAGTASPFFLWFCLGAATILVFIVIIRIARRGTLSRIASRWTALQIRGGEPQRREYLFRKLVNKRSVETLQDLLRAEGSIRWEALQALGELQDPRAVPILIQYLKNRGDRFAQAAAAEALGNYREDRVIEALADTLASEETSFDVVQAAIRSLERWGDASTPSMIRLLTGNSNEGARRAAFFLQDHPDSRAREALADVVRYAREDIRSIAAFALAKLRDDRAVDQLAKDARGVYGSSAVRALRDMGHARAVEALTGLLREGYEAPEVVEALKTLGWKPQSEIEHAAWLVGEGKYHLAADLGPAAIPGLTRFLTNEDAREALARLLSEPQCRAIDDETLHRLADLPDETGVYYVPNDSEYAQMPDLEVEYTISCAPPAQSGQTGAGTAQSRTTDPILSVSRRDYEWRSGLPLSRTPQ